MKVFEGSFWGGGRGDRIGSNLACRTRARKSAPTGRDVISGQCPSVLDLPDPRPNWKSKSETLDEPQQFPFNFPCTCPFDFLLLEQYP